MGGAPLGCSVVKPNTCRARLARWICYVLYNPKYGGVMADIGLNLGRCEIFKIREILRGICLIHTNK